MASECLLFVGNRSISSWSMRAWLALTEKGVRFEERRVDLTAPDRGGFLAKLAPPRKVPVLLHGGLIVYDSLAIMEYVDEAFQGPDLLPATPFQRGRARSLLAWMHAGLTEIRTHMPFEGCFRPTRASPPASALEEAQTLIAAWDDALAHSAGPYLFKSLSLVDLTFVPVLHRFASFGVSLERYERVLAWSQELMERASVRAWLDEASRERG